MLQRKCACGDSASGNEECDPCSKSPLSLQRSTSDVQRERGNHGGAPLIVHEALRSPGQPLDATTRSFMEPRFGHDFSRVRVHTGAQAAESAREMNALAYTVGNHIAFRAGQYAPETTAGKELLAHELS